MAPRRFWILFLLRVHGERKPPDSLWLKLAWQWDVKLYTFPWTRGWVGERASELMSAAEQTSKASSAKQANEWALRANERANEQADERVTQFGCVRLPCLRVHGERKPPDGFRQKSVENSCKIHLFRKIKKWKKKERTAMETAKSSFSQSLSAV